MRDFVSLDARQKTHERAQAADAEHYAENADPAVRELEEDGVINRIVYQQVPPKVEYELSEYGWTLKDILDSLCSWGEKHITKVYGDKFAVLEDSVLNEQLQET